MSVGGCSVRARILPLFVVRDTPRVGEWMGEEAWRGVSVHGLQGWDDERWSPSPWSALRSPSRCTRAVWPPAERWGDGSSGTRCQAGGCGSSRAGSCSRHTEAGVTGVPDQLRGQVIEAFVALRAGHEASEDLRHELIQTVRHDLGPLAVINHVSFVAMLPKTRSGKIMRRLLRDVAENRPLGDTTTLADPTVVQELRERSQSEREEE